MQQCQHSVYSCNSGSLFCSVLEVRSKRKNCQFLFIRIQQFEEVARHKKLLKAALEKWSEWGGLLNKMMPFAALPFSIPLFPCLFWLQSKMQQEQQHWRGLNEDREAACWCWSSWKVEEETVALPLAVVEEEEECDWRIIPSCIIPQLSLFIQLDKQIIPSSLFIATIIHRRAGRPKKSHPPQATGLFLTSTDPQTSTSRVGGWPHPLILYFIVYIIVLCRVCDGWW